MNFLHSAITHLYTKFVNCIFINLMRIACGIILFYVDWRIAVAIILLEWSNNLAKI